ncbi:uncharacterized protein LOC125648857 [Ostrea edulis]|uniref:uncharacterized protein LOC125648857 n=1 Tax=Ostrea edulis TaxID=37623 RepID=UPI0024AFD652|nr:uncharacterized protein LOC125648857 [Ostrea edulis]
MYSKIYGFKDINENIFKRQSVLFETLSFRKKPNADHVTVLLAYRAINKTKMAEDEVREKKAKKRGGRVATLTSERKRRKKEYNQKLAGSRIYIGGAIEKWKSLQQQTKTKTEEEMATMLLERFENEAAFKEPQSVHTSMAMKTSTPSIISRLKNKEYDRTPSMSEISADSEQEPMSGVEELHVSGPEDPGTRKKITSMKPTAEAPLTSRSRKPKKWSDSFCDPLNLSIDISVQDSDLEAVDSEEDDPNYQPSFDVTAILPDDVNSMAEDVAYEEVEFGFELPGNDGQLEGPDIEMGVLPGVHRGRMQRIDYGFEMYCIH